MSSDGWPIKFRALLDDRVRAVAAGLSLEELRAIARGDPPTGRPNPRYLAHTLSLALHLRPRTYPAASTWFSHTFHLGFFTTFFFFVEILTGLILMIYYVPTPEGAYGSILTLLSRVPFGEMLRDVHRLAGEAMLACAVLHMLRVYLSGAYKQERSFTWLTGVVLLLVTLGLAFSGYLLPWDQLAYWAVTIGTSMAEATPLIGREVNLLLRGAQDIGAGGLLRFYLLHVVLLPLLAILLLSVHYYKVARVHGISLPARVEEGQFPPEVKQAARQRLNFIPDILTHELFLVCLGTLALVVTALFIYDAPLERQADPRQTPLDTQAPWFFLWVQGLLKLGDKTLMGVIVPALVFAVLLAVPYLDFNPHRLWRRRPVAVLLAGLAGAALVGLTYMGTHLYGISLPPATRLVQDLAPEEGAGPLHQVPYEELLVGVYPANKTDLGSLPPGLSCFFSQFEQRVNQAKDRNELPLAEAVMIIEDWQANLKRVTLRLSWAEPETSDRKTLEKMIYLHRDR